MSGQDKLGNFVLKHRLTGAAILIGFAVIVLPMLLGGPDESGNGEPNTTSTGDSDTKVFRSNITPIGGSTPSAQSEAPDETRDETQGSEVADASPEPSPPASGDSDAEPGQAADTGKSGERDDEPPVATVKPGDNDQGEDRAGDPPRGWVVQVGVFKNPENVKNLVAQLENGGFGPSTSEVETSEGIATRVWVGPFETRVEAARIKTRVKQKIGSEGLIVAYP